jgi:transposase-like protein
MGGCSSRCGRLPRTEVEMDTKHEDLTAADHVERAQSQGQTVAEYCRQTGQSPHALYSARRQLRKNGALPGSSKRRRAKRKKLGTFIAVSVADSAPSVVCRVRHRNGWVIECASWPDPGWMRDLTGERT